jgi:hypothetical protein
LKNRNAINVKFYRAVAIILYLSLQCSISFPQSQKIEGGRGLNTGENRFEIQNKEREVHEKETKGRSFVEKYCDQVNSHREVMEKVTEYLGYDPDGPDKTRMQKAEEAYCKSLIKNEKEKKEKKDNINFRSNLVEHNGPIALRHFSHLAELSCKQTLPPANQTIVHFSTFNSDYVCFFVLEEKQYRKSAISNLNVKNNWESDFCTTRPNLIVVFSGEFKYYQKSQPTTGSQKGLISTPPCH